MCVCVFVVVWLRVFRTFGEQNSLASEDAVYIICRMRARIISSPVHASAASFYSLQYVSVLEQH